MGNYGSKSPKYEQITKAALKSNTVKLPEVSRWPFQMRPRIKSIVKTSPDLLFLSTRMVWISSGVNGSHVHRRRCWVLNRLIGILAECFAGLTALATTARVDAATRHAEHKGEAPDENVWPVARYRTLDVLLLLGGRNGGVRLLRSWEECLRRRVCRVRAVQAGLDKVGTSGGGVGEGQQLDVGITAIVGRVLNEVSVIKEGIKVAHYAAKGKQKKKG